jgi:hypothetical protein
MADLHEMDAFGMLRADWSSAYEITRRAGTAQPYRAVRRDDPGSVLNAKTPAELRGAIRADYARRPVSRDVAP